MKNRFVIICPSFNNEEWVETHIESIKCQTYDNYKVIYINDNSTDNTENVLLPLIENDNRFIYIKNESNQGALKNMLNGFENYCEENDIVLQVDGDDWLSTPTVLENLNELYNKYDYWMSYGKMVAYDENGKIKEANPQNSPFHEFTHKHQYYRRDTWRSSHLRAFRKFLFDKIDKNDFISKIDNKLYWNASDLALMYPMLEMCPVNKIGVIPFITYVYNASKSNQVRTREREGSDNIKFEDEIRNKKVYVRKSSKEELNGEKLPQVNYISDYKERNSIPTNHSIVYNRTDGEFDITLVQDNELLKIISGEIKVNRGKIIADVHEPPYLFDQSEVYQKVYSNYKLFDKILTNNEKLLTLPNAVFRNSGFEVVLNKNVHQQTYPILQDNSLINIYSKSKNISFITSNKTFTKGHVFRIDCLQHLVKNKSNVDVFGVGIKEIIGKIDALQDYRFSIAIENGKCKNYFTEKILDCFLTGTIPIYHGCPNIGDFFNTDGFFVFETKEELLKIINSLTEKDYIDRINLIKENFKKADKWWCDNDRFFEKYIKNYI